MSDPYRLLKLGNSELLAGLSALVRRGNELTAQLLAHLLELEERMLHLELGYSSLFSYCTEALGMSEGAAGRRVAAARVCRRISGVFERVARGDLHLCALCALAPHLTEENAAELFGACRGKTRRQIEELLATRFPRPDVREQIRRLPSRTKVALTEPVAVTRAGDSTPVGQQSATILANLSGIAGSGSTGPASAVPTAPTPAEQANPFPAVANRVIADARRRAREFEPLSSDRFGVHFTADAELRELIERARQLASHRLPNGDLASLVKLMAQNFVRQEEKRRFGLGVRPRRSNADKKVDVAVETGAKAGAEGPVDASARSRAGAGARPRATGASE